MLPSTLIPASALIVTLVTGMAIPAHSRAMPATNHDHHAVAKAPATLTKGKVKKISPESGTITIAHDPIVHLGMPAMTMTFRVKDSRLLTTTALGDTIRFMVMPDAGRMVVTAIHPDH